MPYPFPGGLPPEVFYTCLGCPPSPAPPPGPTGPLAAVTTNKQGFGLRVLLDFDLGGLGVLSVSWARVTPSGGATYYGPLKSVSDLSNFSDWNQIPDVTIEMEADRLALFQGKLQSIRQIHQTHDLRNRLVAIRFWIDETPFSAAMQISLLRTRTPVEYTEQSIKIRAVGIQRDLPDRLGKVVTLDDFPDAHEEDLGRILPIAVGNARRVRGVQIVDASETLLEGAIDFNDTTITVADTTRFPSSGTIRIDDELLTYTGKTATTFTGATRGASSTEATDHFTGARVIEVGTVKYAFSGVRATAIGNVYGPDGQPIPGGTKTPADTTTLPGSTLATVTYTEQPLISVIEGPTSFAEVPLQLHGSSFGPIIDGGQAFRLSAGFQQDKFARIVPGPQAFLVGEVPSGGIEDLGEIVQIRLGVRHHGFGQNGVPIVVGAPPGQPSVGNLAPGQPVEVQAFDAGINVSGSANVNTDINHDHARNIQALGTVQTPADTPGGGKTSGWISLIAGQVSGAPGPVVVGPVYISSVLSFDQPAAAVHKRVAGVNETLEIRWDVPGSVVDIGNPLVAATVVVVHGTAIGSDSFRVRLDIAGAGTLLDRIVSGSGSRTTFRSARFPISGLTVNALHNSNSFLRIVPQSSTDGNIVVVHAAFLLIEVFDPILGDTNRFGTGPLAGSGSLSNRRDTWEIVEEFFDVDPTIADWDDLPASLFSLDTGAAGSVSIGSEVWIREMFVQVEYRKRVLRKPEFLSADVTGVPDTSHPSGAANGTYTGTPGALIVNPIQQLEWWFTEVMGFSRARIDTAYNDTQEGDYTTDGHTMDGALMEAMGGLKFVQRFIFEGRIRLFLFQDKIRFKRIPAVEDADTFTFDISNIIVEDTQRSAPVLIEEVDQETIINALVLHHRRKNTGFADRLPRHTGGSGVRRGLVEQETPQLSEFEGLVMAEDAVSITAHGERRREYHLNFIDSPTIAQDLADLYVSKYASARTTATFHSTFRALGVAPDDVVKLDWPTLGLTTADEWRVIEEKFLVGDPSVGRAPRKRFRLLRLLPAEIAP